MAELFYAGLVVLACCALTCWAERRHARDRCWLDALADLLDPP